LRRRRAADVIIFFQEQDTEASPGEIRGSDQPIMASAQDNHVVLRLHSFRDDGEKDGGQQDYGKLTRQRNLCHRYPMRVLIADDDKSVGTSLAELVRRCQHEVVEVVTSGLEAIQAYGRHHPDVVLMDYQMPKLNGATACRNIVAKYPDARIILVSGLPRDVAGSGAIRILMKPVNLDQIYAALYDASQPRPST
jgi:two-component system chemotaxis response regulator CheY